MTTKEPSKNLTKKFIEGLKTYGLSLEQINSEGWFYCGGNTGSRFKTFKQYCGFQKLLPHFESKCICGHPIVENCYITKDKEFFLVIGNCCIKKFIKKSGRTCEKCGSSHRNTSTNKCNDCRENECSECGKSCKYRESRCENCKKNYCIDCKKECYPYQRCYECNKINKDRSKELVHVIKK